MSEISVIHFLKITGMIDGQKKDEFERTVKFVRGLLSSECIEHSLSTDTNSDDTYYYFISCSSEKALKVYIESNEYELVRSAYDVLGVLQKIEIGYNAEIKTIHIPPF
jgi:hypothetical protein